jgi:thioredoxin 1
MNIVKVTTGNFKSEVLESEQAVLADFWAVWCMPCRMMEPVVEKLAQAYEGKLKVVKVNVDEEADLAAQFNIQSIPSFLVFHKGQMVNQVIGAVPQRTLETVIKDYV